MATNNPEMGELRIVIRYTTTDVPGASANRAIQVTDNFAQKMLSRAFSYDQDFVHLPTDFDSDKRKAIYICCDFNVRERRPDINDIPIQFWKATYGNELTANFTEHHMNAKQYVNTHYPWGGRSNEWEYRLQPKEGSLCLVDS